MEAILTMNKLQSELYKAASKHRSKVVVPNLTANGGGVYFTF